MELNNFDPAPNNQGAKGIPKQNYVPAPVEVAIGVPAEKLGIDLGLPGEGWGGVCLTFGLEVGIIANDTSPENHCQVVTRLSTHSAAYDTEWHEPIWQECDDLTGQFAHRRQPAAQLKQDRCDTSNAYLSEITSLEAKLDAAREESKVTHDLAVSLQRKLDDIAHENVLQERQYVELQDSHDIHRQDQTRLAVLRQNLGTSRAKVEEMRRKLDDANKKLNLIQAEARDHRLEHGAQLMEAQERFVDVKQTLAMERAAREAFIEQYSELMAEHEGLLARHEDLVQQHLGYATQLEQQAVDLAAARGDINRLKKRYKSRRGKTSKMVSIAKGLEAEYETATQDIIALRGLFEDIRIRTVKSEAKYEDLKVEHDKLSMVAVAAASSPPGTTMEEVEALRVQVEQERTEKELCMAECEDLKGQVEIHQNMFKLNEVVHQFRAQTGDVEGSTSGSEKMLDSYREKNRDLARERERLMQNIKEMRRQRDWLARKLKGPCQQFSPLPSTIGSCSDSQDVDFTDPSTEIHETIHKSLFETALATAQPPSPLHHRADIDDKGEDGFKLLVPDPGGGRRGPHCSSTPGLPGSCSSRAWSLKGRFGVSGRDELRKTAVLAMAYMHPSPEESLETR